VAIPARVSLVTLGVADVARSTRFYESLGWRRSSASMAVITFFNTSGPVLALFGREDLAEDATVDPAGSGFRGVTLSMNVETLDAVDAVYDEWLAAGASPVRAPVPAVFPGGRIAYVADPDGHLWEIAHNPHFPADARGRVTAPE
jgi:catechol 2,3-dioxygenase-like lactoylglutathione lyase family enzyme